jgi:hypothetical protein
MSLEFGRQPRLRGSRRSSVGRRALPDRRFGERRAAVIFVAIERRSGADRRSGQERRNGMDRRVLSDRRAGGVSVN